MPEGGAAWVIFRFAALLWEIYFWIGPIICDTRNVLRFGPRYWRVTRMMHRRAWKRGDAWAF
jgi:hypothetical protein